MTTKKKKRSSQFLMLLVGVTSLALSSFPASSLAYSSTDLAFQLQRLGISAAQDDSLFLNMVCYLKPSLWAFVRAVSSVYKAPFQDLSFLDRSKVCTPRSNPNPFVPVKSPSPASTTMTHHLCKLRWELFYISPLWI